MGNVRAREVLHSRLKRCEASDNLLRCQKIGRPVACKDNVREFPLARHVVARRRGRRLVTGCKIEKTIVVLLQGLGECHSNDTSQSSAPIGYM